MNSRPSRSSSIPIPRSASSSSSARNIEAVLSIPVVSPRQTASSSSSARPVMEPRRIGSLTTDVSTNTSGSPIRSTTRSISLVSSVPGRTQTTTRTSFEPRVIRGLGIEHSNSEVDCPPQTSSSPSHNRRVSMGSVRASGSHQTVVPQHIVAHAAHMSFERPAYLDYSSFRHLLQTEASALAASSRKADHKVTQGLTNHHHIAMSPQSENDDDSTSMSTFSRPSSTTQPQDQVFNLPTRWSEQQRHQNLTISSDGLDLSYHGPPSNGEKDASVARANYGIPPACGIYYFEVEIQGKEQKSHISIGFGVRNIKTSRMPGWEPNSWCYYGEDGTALTSEKGSAPYGPSFGAGDTIGCGIDFTNNTAFYTRNGSLLGPVFPGIGKNVELYPVIGLQHVGEVIRTNFGQDAFKFDIDYHVQRKSSEVWNTIQSTPLHQTILQGHRRRSNGLLSIASITNNTSLRPTLTDEQSKSMLKQLVASYLVHHGYVKTARAFETREDEHRATTPRPSLADDNHDVEMSASDVVESDIETRTNIVNSVLAGNIDFAMEALQKHYPTVLEAEDRLVLFKLRCRNFVELILETVEMKKRMTMIRTKETEKRKDVDPVQTAWTEEEMDIDFNGDELASSASPRTTSYSHFNEIHTNFGTVGSESVTTDDISSHYESALNAAILYGQTLSNDCQSDTRPELQQLFRQTFGIVAWEDPLEAGGPIAELAGYDARIALAHEVNQAILKSQGRPAQPTLETLYRHTSVCINQLGLLGVGAAAYADMQKEYTL